MEILENAIDASFTEIAQNIKKIRKEHDLTQKQMSRLLKIDTQYYSRLERGDDPIGSHGTNMILDFYLIKFGLKIG